MKKIILVRYGEIMLKGLNRPAFEGRLVKNIKKSLYGIGRSKVIKSQGRIYVEPDSEDYDFDAAIEKLTKVFGIVSISPVWKIDSNFEEMKKYSEMMIRDIINRKGNSVYPLTFKVQTRRGNKKFHLKSPEINAKLGAYILGSIPSLTVDVNNPSITLYVEVREFTYIYSEIIPASGGMPVGTNGKALLLLSGGIDSPVAGWMMAKRGVEIEAVYFHSYPYTSERAKEKVIDLAKILSAYCYEINLHIVPFTEIQTQINEKCPPHQMTIIMRRFMMRIAEKLSQSTGSLALITGESMGQVASQTIQSLAVTNAVVDMPVFRPLIGMDKNEIIQIAREIGTFETSILPYEDCCTVFVAKHPETKPNLEKIINSESRLAVEKLIDKAVENTESISVFL
jgi:thiamine biosynthesis protein ThiI